MLTVLVMLIGLVAGLALAYLVDSAYTEATARNSSRSCAACAFYRRKGLRSYCTCPENRKQAGYTPTCVRAIMEDSLCGPEHRRFSPAERR